MDNLTIITNEFNQLKGQMVICSDQVYRLIGIADDDEDWYYALYDGRRITLHSCVGRIIPLKGFIQQRDYDEMIRIAKLNHYDLLDDGQDFIKQIENEITNWETTRFILGPHWELN
jgi:hypothetical protein